LSEKQVPQVVGNIEKPKQGMEWREAGVVLAEQVLCQFEIRTQPIPRIYAMDCLTANVGPTQLVSG
jgi:hypothetical protein